MHFSFENQLNIIGSNSHFLKNCICARWIDNDSYLIYKYERFKFNTCRCNKKIKAKAYKFIIEVNLLLIAWSPKSFWFLYEYACILAKKK